MRVVQAAFALSAMLFSTATLAAPLTADKMLLSSTPAADAVTDAPVEAVSLTFAEKAELLSVTLAAPDGMEQEVFQQSFEPGSPKKTGKAFEFALDNAATMPGRYTLSYLLTSGTFKSLNGFVHFEIAGAAAADVPVSDTVAPDLIEMQPAEMATVAGPVADVLMRFGSKVRLIEVVLIAPDQTRYGLVGPQEAESAEEASIFVLPFADPVSMPGTWLVDYTVHQRHEAGQWLQTSAFASFIIAEPQ